MMAATSHTPVLLDEVIAWLEPQSGGAYIDATVGLGGHAEAILERSSPHGRLFGMDRDAEALSRARERLAIFGMRAVLVQGSFDGIAEAARRNGFEHVDGIIADLGISSMQLDSAERGFSFMRDGPLDMRMDRSRGESAAAFIARASEAELADVLFRYGEERMARRIARRIRDSLPLGTTAKLAAVVAGACGGRRGRIHPATRTFQALRIAVNDELGMLERFLAVAPTLLKSRGRLVVISYHSLEDRLVKNAFRTHARRGGAVLTKKVIVPGRPEVIGNPRARSARMRVFEAGET